jgi:hypothetical protein
MLDFWVGGLETLMPVTYSQFLTLIASALRDENGLDLAYLIRPVSSHSKDLIKEFRNPTVRRGSLQLFLPQNATSMHSANLCLGTKAR